MAQTKILICVDQILIAEDLRELLTLQGYEVTALVRCGADALLISKLNPPDVVIMDLECSRGLDGLDGSTTAKLLREQVNEKIEVIYITGLPLNQINDVAPNDVAPKVLTKPFTKEGLHELLQLSTT